MNSLLKRQIRKYLSEDLKNNAEIAAFINAVNLSYNNFDEQSSMIQRAMSISSDELYAANRKLQNEAEEQKKVIEKLKSVINTLKYYNLEEDHKPGNVELTGSNLVDFIDNQTKEIIEMNKQKQALLNELAHQNQELSDYAHMVSHDLKSPLRSIDTLTAWLAQDYNDIFDANGIKTLNLIRDNVEKMDTLISGILEYSTIGKNEVAIYDVDVNNLIDNLIKTLHIPKHIHITKTNLPIIKGDKYRLQQLFQNLIGNAVKYNDKAKGTIEIGVKNLDTYWQFYIKDNGKGIEEAYFDKIFKTFEKLENNPDSSGIGLSIVKKIVELYGGKIWLESQVNIGTTFYFTLKKSPNGTA
ncbi:GHKL domain-containing protein [Lacinutrix sp. C3R15]|uniref:sensor histidine kinase n=1 Tax=Flavobacteriaceae TaxID=49546 RepID=UPI001C08E340|nr:MULTISPECIES: ATP-binding protein [Flavobacteriaceae]MBU2938170.1 GHKL domain-containing protein [Lacinutrix sp. C3R15]MDO6621484.1 ATP-binding protein [Oceanihabitans sp. 1_MG-2023]